MGNQHRACKVRSKVARVQLFRRPIPSPAVEIEIPPYHVVDIEIPSDRGVMRPDNFPPSLRPRGNNHGAIDATEKKGVFFPA